MRQSASTLRLFAATKLRSSLSDFFSRREFGPDYLARRDIERECEATREEMYLATVIRELVAPLVSGSL
jgi:hypothetical protein